MNDQEKIDSAIRFIEASKAIFEDLAYQGVGNMDGVLKLCDKEVEKLKA